MYKALIQPDVLIDNNSNNKLWKLKIPFMIKVFGCYLRNRVILTKDNFANQNWQVSKKYVFRLQDEKIKHLFFQCSFARSIWSVIQLASTLYPSHSIINIFGNWLHDINHRFKNHIRMRAITIIWLLWLSKNDKVFNDKTLLFCRLFIDVPILSVCGCLQRVENREK
jgi:hypothetical protein